MELLLRNGDYVPDGRGGFARVTLGEELLQRVLFKLTARRGSFPLIPELGSRLFELHGYKQRRRESAARQFVTEALKDERELTVENVTVTPCGESLMVTVSLSYHGETLNMTVEV